MRWQIIAVLALLSAVLAFGWVHTAKSLHAATARAERAEAILVVDTTVAKHAAVRASATRKREQKQDATVEKALEAHPDWAAEPLPAGIADSLRP